MIRKVIAVLFVMMLLMPLVIAETTYVDDFLLSYVLNLYDPYTEAYIEDLDGERISGTTIEMNAPQKSGERTEILFNFVLESNEQGAYSLGIKCTHFSSNAVSTQIPFYLTVFPEDAEEDVIVDSSPEDSDEFTYLSEYKLEVPIEGNVSRKLFGVSYTLKEEYDTAATAIYTSDVTVVWSAE